MRPGLPWLALLAWSAAAIAAAQPEVRVHAEARLELRTEHRPNGVALHGFLRDDLGMPLADRPVTVRSTEPGSSFARTVRTDARGAFEVALPADEAERVEVQFDGDRTHDATRAARTVDPSRADVRLQLQVPREGRLDLSKPKHELLVWATAAAPAGGAGLRVLLEDELGRRLATETTDERGRARLVVRSDALGPPGAGRLKARTPGDATRGPAQTEVPIVRQLRTRLTLALDGDGDGVALEGTLSDDRGPLPHHAVGLFLDGREHLATVLTDGRGHFTHRLAEDALPETATTVTARYDSDSAGLTSTESAPVALPALPPSRAPWAWLLLPMALTAGLLLWLGHGRPTGDGEPRRPRAPAPLTTVETAQAVARTASRRDLAVRVRDRRDDRPVPDAMAILQPATGEPRSAQVDAAGSFAASTLEDGTWRLRVEARGYAPVEAEVTVPHRGEWSGATLRMDSYRALALAPFRRVAERWVPGLRHWGTWTNREVAQRARARGAGGAFEQLTDAVERVYYGPETPSRSDLDAVADRADDAMAETTGEPAGDPVASPPRGG